MVLWDKNIWIFEFFDRQEPTPKCVIHFAEAYHGLILTIVKIIICSGGDMIFHDSLENHPYIPVENFGAKKLGL